MLLAYYNNKKSGQVVLFIHGTASENGIWERQYKLLNKSNYRVIGVDLRGHGNSQKPKGISSIDDHISDLKETIEHLNVDEPITIVGHSFGAVLAVKFAEIYPELVNKLLLVSLPARIPRILCLYYKWLLGKPIKVLKRKLKLVSRLPILKRYKVALDTDLGILRQIWRDSLDWDFLSCVPKVNCPVYLSVGRFDYVSLKSRVRKLHEELPNSNYKVFNWSFHTCMEDEPNEFDKWILSILSPPIIQQ